MFLALNVVLDLGYLTHVKAMQLDMRNSKKSQIETNINLCVVLVSDKRLFNRLFKLNHTKKHLKAHTHT